MLRAWIHLAYDSGLNWNDLPLQTWLEQHTQRAMGLFGRRPPMNRISHAVVTNIGSQSDQPLQLMWRVCVQDLYCYSG